MLTFSRTVVRVTTLAIAVAFGLSATPASAVDPTRSGSNGRFNATQSIPGNPARMTQPVVPQQGVPQQGVPNYQPSNAYPTTNNVFQPTTTNQPGNWNGGQWQQPGGPAQFVPPLASQAPVRFDGRFTQPVSQNVTPDATRGFGNDNLVPSFQPGPNPSQPQTPSAGPNRWRLGVFTRDTYTGVEVVRVPADGPAYNVGLESGDKIVAVNGFRVGDVHGVRYDLGAEFNLRADENGLVHLLVQDHNTGSLQNISVNLDPRLSRVTGQITWQTQQPLPSHAYGVVELREIFRPGAQPIVVKSQEITALRSNDATFEIEFDPGEIDQTKQYVVAAYITDGRLTYFRDVRPMPVITQNAPRQVAVAMQQIYDWTGRQQYAEADEFKEFERMWRKYMGRPLRPTELAVYRDQFNRGTFNEQDVAINAFSHPDFYNSQCNADDRNFVVNVYRLRTGHDPTEAEIQYWLAKLEQAPGVRRQTTREMVSKLN